MSTPRITTRTPRPIRLPNVHLTKEEYRKYTKLSKKMKFESFAAFQRSAMEELWRWQEKNNC